MFFVSSLEIKLADGEVYIMSGGKLKKRPPITAAQNTLDKTAIQSKIEALDFSNEMTKNAYLYRLQECKTESELNDLIEVIAVGEEQLYFIQNDLFQLLEKYIWRIQELHYLSLMRKKSLIEELITCELQDEMEELYLKAVVEEEVLKISHEL